jgi:hypothetical protein
MMVQHASLGLGKIVALEEKAVHVFFAMSDARFATKLRLPTALPLLAPAATTNAWLSRLSGFSFDAKTGRYGLAGQWLSHADAAARFLEVFPKGFADPGYVGGGEDKRDRPRDGGARTSAYVEALGAARASGCSRRATSVGLSSVPSRWRRPSARCTRTRRRSRSRMP